jgi:predicted DsbA family dithiol-disulfide isomerase
MKVLTEIAGSIGIDKAGFSKALIDELLRRKQEKALKHAYFKSGVEEVPTYIAAGMRLSGAVGRETLKQFLEDSLAEEKRITESRISASR